MFSGGRNFRSFVAGWRTEGTKTDPKIICCVGMVGRRISAKSPTYILNVPYSSIDRFIGCSVRGVL